MTVVTDDNRQRVDDMIRADRRITVGKIVASSHCEHDVVHRIIENLGYRKVCEREKSGSVFRTTVHV